MQRLVLRLDDKLTVVKAESAAELYRLAREKVNRTEQFRLVVEESGKEIFEDDIIQKISGLKDAIVCVEFVVLGGKGGFGSLLRIAAAQKKHFNNFDSARDFNGRRLRDIKNELRLVDFVRKKKKEQDFVNKELEEVQKANNQPKANLHNQTVNQVDEAYSSKVKEWNSHLNQVIRQAAAKKKNKKKVILEDTADELDTNQVAEESEHLGKRKASEQSFDKPIQDRFDSKDDRSMEPVKMQVIKSPLKIVKSTKESPLKTVGIVGPLLNQSSLPEYQEIELASIHSLEDLTRLSPDHLKHELKRLGLKCGGSPEERAKRLYDIKLNPSNIFNSKYLSKPNR